MQRLVKHLEDLNEFDRKYITFCNRKIRWARRMMKVYGEAGFYKNYSKDFLQYRAETKQAILRRLAKIETIKAQAA